MPDHLDTCLYAAHSAGKLLLDWQGRFKIKEKGPKDLVTEADLASQEAIRGILLGAFPDYDFVGEEDAADRKSQGLPPIPQRRSEFRWIVDPLDGTTNYVHGLPGFATTIALQQGNDVVLGVTHDPLTQDTFVVVRGQRPTLNGQPLTTSSCTRAVHALIAVSFPPHVTRDSPEIRRFIEGLLACQSVRRLGSAALNLAYVAAGRLDAYWATSVSIWDIAAGLLMVQEAGGIATALDGSSLNLERPEFVASASPALHQELLNVLKRASAPKPL
jgi:myo-inositol-1(or 4)-monophosphatase